MTVTATPTAGKGLLTPADHSLILVDHQSQMAFATASIDIGALRTNTALVATAARDFDVPTILTTVAEKTFSGPIFSEIKDVFPDAPVYDRTTMNAWEDAQVTDAVNRAGKSRIVIAGLWTSVCIVGPVLSAIDQGFEVFVITDASGDVSTEAHERGRRCSYASALGHGAWTFIRSGILLGGFLDGPLGIALAIAAAEGAYYRYLKLYQLSRDGGANGR